ncbi:MAG: archaemetzincin family Zn-dependent metalloprotease [Candidatus Brocadiales bacterium]|nr:archaemetzincin family Zn-dependent metalloprotease [Candidatus Bathyanammoxibius sp.]
MWTTLNIMFVCLVVLSAAATTSYGAEVPRVVRLIPVGEIQEGLLRELAGSLKKNLGVVAQVGPGIEVPADAYNTKRKQYFSTDILRELSGMRPGGKLYLLGVTELDLYVPTLNFVFGEALPFRNVAIISLHRLREEFYGRDADNIILSERMAKEAVHELGHIWRLRHCPNPRCVMYFSNSLADTDKKPASFCKNCQPLLKLKRHDK